MGVALPSLLPFLSSVRGRFSGVASLSGPEADSRGRFVGVQSVPWAVSVHDAPSLLLMNVGSSVDSCSELEGCDEDDDEDDVRDWLLLLVSLLKTGEGLLPLLWMGFEVQSSPGCFFWMSAKHLEQRFMVLLDPQNPHGQRGGRAGGLLRSLVSPMTFNTKSPSGKREASVAACSFNEKNEPAFELDQKTKRLLGLESLKR